MDIGVTVRAIFNRRSIKLAKGDKAPVLIEVYFKGGKRKYINTTISIEQDQWGTSGVFKNKVKPNHPNYIEINQFLTSKINEIESLIYNTTNNGGQFTPIILDNLINNKMVSLSFYDFYEEELKADGVKVTDNTKHEHGYTLRMLRKYKADARFSDVTYDFVEGFDRYLRSLKLAQNTIAKHHKHIKRFLNIAIKRNYFDGKNNPYLHFKSLKVKGGRENLTKEEVGRILDLEIDEKDKNLAYSRELFLFSCYTGLRYGDVLGLTNEKVDVEKDKITIRTTMEKVEYTRNVKVILPLHQLFNGEPIKILQKHYNSENPAKHPVFRYLSNSELNIHLKTIAGLAKIKLNLTFHIARHTFGTLLADITANPYLIMQLMGHADIKTSMIYIHQSESRLTKSLEKYESINWVPSKNK